MHKSVLKLSIYSLILVFALGACNKASIQKANKHFDNKEFAVAGDMYAKVSKDPKATKKDKLTAAIQGLKLRITITIIKLH
jgi:hypothetical protein